MREKMAVGVVAMVLAAAWPALGAVYTYDFAIGDGGIVNLYWDGNAQNSGGESPAFRLGNIAKVTLFKVVLPADLNGATIHSATLSISSAETFDPLINVEMYMIDPAAPEWSIGNGTWADRYGAKDVGATLRFADHNLDGGGVTWAGRVTTADWDFDGDASEEIFGTLLDALDVTGSGTINSFNVQAAVEAWAAGQTNRGLALSLLNQPNYELYDAAHMFSATGPGLGLVIDYTPIPEPGMLSLLALGGLAMHRRRGRQA